MSISILPTIFSNLLHIKDEYVFKLIYQIIFSFAPLTVFLILKKYVNSIYAFLGSFYFISQFQFMQQMPALNRQEIAILFFSLCILLFHDDEVKPLLKKLLFLVFFVSMTVSHYSTAYIALALFTITYIFSLIFRNTVLRMKRFSLLHKQSKSILNIKILAMCWISTFFWYGQYTNTIGNLSEILYKSVSNYKNFLSEELRSEQAKLVLWGTGKIYNFEDINKYKLESSAQFRKDKSWIHFYKEETTQKYSLVPRYANFIPVKDIKINQISNITIEFIKKMVKVLIPIGLCYMLYSFLKRKGTIVSHDIVIVSITFIVLLLGITILPVLSISYNF